MSLFCLRNRNVTPPSASIITINPNTLITDIFLLSGALLYVLLEAAFLLMSAMVVLLELVKGFVLLTLLFVCGVLSIKVLSRQ